MRNQALKGWAPILGNDSDDEKQGTRVLLQMLCFHRINILDISEGVKGEKTAPSGLSSSKADSRQNSFHVC